MNVEITPEPSEDEETVILAAICEEDQKLEGRKPWLEEAQEP